MQGIIEEEEMEEEGSDEEAVVDENVERWSAIGLQSNIATTPKPALFRTSRTCIREAWQQQWMGVFHSLKSN